MKKGGLLGIILGVGALVLVVVFIYYATPGIADQAQAFVTVAKTQPVNAVITAVGVTNSTATLQFPLHDGNINGITSITSDHSTDNPIATTYNLATKLLTIEGLTENATRNLTVNYLSPRPDLVTGATTFSGWGVVAMSILAFAVIIAVIYFIVK